MLLPLLALGLGVSLHPGVPACAATPEAAGFERQMLDLVNAERRDTRYTGETHRQAAALVWNEGLAAVARCHSRIMARGGRFSHTEAGDGGLTDRLAQAAIAWHAAAENIAMVDTVSQAERMFLAEPPHRENHRANILNSAYTQLGIGIVIDSQGELYITQDFLAP